MKRGFWNKRIPTLFGLLIILAGTIITTYFANGNQLGQVNAVSSNQPQDVRITNITDNSFTVSYTTEAKTSGSINYGKDKNLGQNALDDRDQIKGGFNQYIIHSITAKTLEPSTKYYFTITSGGQTYTTNGEFFEITTAPTISAETQTEDFIKGKVIDTSGNPPAEAIIYITSENLQVASLLVDANGEYNFPISALRTSDLSSIYNFSDVQVIKMLAVGEGTKSNVIVSYSGIENVPVITLSKDYDFVQEENKNATSTAVLENSLSFPVSSSTNSAKTVKIISPSKDEGFSDQQPKFEGTANPNQSVQIIIHSDQQIQATVTTDSSGNWSYIPTTPLSPGNHTITVTTKNSAGILQTLTESFVVYAQEISPTPTITPLITITPTSTEISTISATTSGELPTTGNQSIIIAGIIGIIISLAGGLLYLLTRGGI